MCRSYREKKVSEKFENDNWGSAGDITLFQFIADSELLMTINVPLFKKMRDIIDFLGDNHFISHFEGHFKGSKKSRPP